LSRHSWPDPYDPRRAEGLEEEARRLSSETDACLVARSPQSAGFLEYGAWLRGDENFLADLFLAEEFSSALFDKICELQLGYYNVLLGTVGSYVDIVETSEDYGSASGLLISPETFRKYIKPRRTAINAFIKSKCPHVKILHHSCGAIRPIISDLIETGIDILNPVQPNLPGMTGGELKAEFGDILCFCGGADMITLATGSDEDIENDVRARMSEYASSGGGPFNSRGSTEGMCEPGYRDGVF
jgi:uroporphyrinogen decarboxylase